MLPFSWWSAVDFGAGGFYKIIFIFTITIIINTKHTYDKIFQYTELWRACGGAVG